jgi:hypothetical protein
MSSTEKLMERLRDRNRDAGWSFGELGSLLQRLGFEMRIHGSHHFFRRPGVSGAINLQPHGGQAKPYQVRQVRRVLNEQGRL